jgi:uncharacterized membrane protein
MMMTDLSRPVSPPVDSNTLKQERMEVLLGTFLLAGVLLSVSLIVLGMAWYFASTHHLRLEYELAGMNLFQLLAAEIGMAWRGQFHPELLINGGIAALMLTPYLRVLLSMLYFMGVLKNWKYTVITSIVLVVLTFSLFLR